MFYKGNFRFQPKIFLPAKPTGQFSRKYSLDTSNVGNVGPKYIVNKKENMDNIRKTIISNFGEFDGKKYFIGVTHTYPAWINIFSATKSLKQLSMALQKQSHSVHNPYGHILADFFCVEKNKETNEITQDFVMNVGTLGPNGINKKDFIHFIPSDFYYFNNNVENNGISGNQQGGILERSFLSLVYEVEEDVWRQMFSCYHQTRTRSLVKGDAEFGMGLFMITNKFRRFFPGGKEKGNCCYWTSQAFHESGMLMSRSNFPLVLFFKVLINLIFQKGSYFDSRKEKDYSIVFYKGLHHNEIPKGSFMYPFYWLKHGYEQVWKPEKMADIIIEPIKIDNEKYTIEIKKIPKEDARKTIMPTIDYVKKVLKLK